MDGLTGLLARLVGPRLRCDTCGKTSRLTVTDHPQPSGGLLRVMQCRHCGREYPVARISARGRVIMSELKSATPERAAELREEMKREVTRP